MLGEVKECEGCYTYYLGVMETIFGDNTIEMGECYGWLG